jgi:hypothetical protein
VTFDSHVIVSLPSPHPPPDRPQIGTRCAAVHPTSGFNRKSMPPFPSSLLPPPAPPPPPTLLLESATQHGFGSPHKPPKDTSLEFLACSSSESYPLYPQFGAKQQALSLSPLWDGACTPSSTMVKGACGGCRTWQCPGTGVLWQSPGGICQRCAKFRPRREAWHPCPQTFSQQGMPRCASGPRGTVFLGVIDCRGENARGAGASKHHSQAPLDP